MKIFFDTEFIEDGKTIDLLSIGMVNSDGVTLYLENSDADWAKANPWVQENVLPKLDAWEYRLDSSVGRLPLGPGPDDMRPPCYKPRAQIRDYILDFIGDEPPEFWAYYADYDWVVLCQLFGKMIDLPKGWPMFCMDLKQLVVERDIVLPKLPERVAHNALVDAEWVRSTHNGLLT